MSRAEARRQAQPVEKIAGWILTDVEAFVEWAKVEIPETLARQRQNGVWPGSLTMRMP